MNRKGWVLAETIAAVAIMGIALASISQSLVVAYRVAVQNQDTTKALLLLRNKLQDYYLVGGSHIQEEESACPDPLSRFRYKAAYLPESEALGQKPLYVTLAWSSGTHTKQLAATILLPLEGADAKTNP